MMIGLKYKQGFSLIEVLVSLLILAVGLLGLMSLQLTALQTNNNANFRSLATIAAYDMSERIRANQVGYEAGSYNSISTEDAGGTSSIVAQDIKQWHDDLKENLPEGKGSVSAAGTAADGLDITITWKENDKSGSNVTKTFVLRARFE